MVAEGRVNREMAAKYAGQFREGRLLRDLTVLPRDRRWREGPPPVEAEPHRVVLYIGCNVLRTSHMVRAVIDVFDTLGVDYVAVGGAAYCCGSPYQRGGDKELADAVAARTVRFFERYQPERVVMWCPSCIFLYDEVYDIPASYKTQQVAEFLAEHIGEFTFVLDVAQKVALHYHSNRPRRVQEGRAAEALLSAVPGLELVRSDADARLDRACTEANQQKLGMETWRGIIEGQCQSAVDAGATVFATMYHGCQRMLCTYEERYPLAVEHYLSVFARALGVEHEDKYKQYRLWRDPARVLAEVSPCMYANHVDPADTRRVVEKVFPAEG